MPKRRWPTPARAAAALAIGCCALVALVDEPLSFLTPSAEGRWEEDQFGHRSLQSSEDRAVRVRVVNGEVRSGAPAGARDAMYPWARTLLRPLTATPEPSRETVLFWHIPKSGGSTAKSIYRCLGKTIDIESQPKEIMRAKELGLVQSGKVDMIFSSFPDYAIQHLYDNSHKARVLAMFRHPVERLISKFYYLQIATWERTYRPEWKTLDILEWAQKHNMDNDHMTKKLAGKVQKDTATEDDLRLAMRTIKARFVVGLMDEMEESVHRFNTVMGIDEEETRNARCLGQYFGATARKSNSNKHPKVEKDSPAYKLLARQNSYDIQLYEYVVKLFGEQRQLIETYRSAMAQEVAMS